jgi:hypothetical protein
MHQRFGSPAAESLKRMTAYPHGANFPPDVGAYGPTRMRRSASGPSRTPATFFHQEVHHDYLCLNQRGARAYASTGDSAQADDLLFTATHDLSGQVVVNDAIVITDRFSRHIHVVLVSSHNETAQALEQYFHRYGVPLTIGSDG